MVHRKTVVTLNVMVTISCINGVQCDGLTYALKGDKNLSQIAHTREQTHGNFIVSAVNHK